MLQGEASRFGNHEVCEDCTESTCGTPDEKDFSFEVAIARIDKVRGDDCEDTCDRQSGLLVGDAPTVEEPIGSSGDGDTFRSDRKLEDLAYDNPACWSPC